MSNREILDAMHNPALQENGYNDVVTQVDFRLSDHPNPRKARKKNISAAISALKPTKRSGFSLKRYTRGKFRHIKPHECVICGIECMNADYGDLFDEYPYANSRERHFYSQYLDDPTSVRAGWVNPGDFETSLPKKP